LSKTLKSGIIDFDNWPATDSNKNLSDDDSTQVSRPKQEPIDVSRLQPGLILADKYEIISRIGSGGMGAVYRVKQIHLEKEFALKVLDANVLSDTTAKRFQIEARTAAQLKHPNLVLVHDYGLIGEQPYLVMELIEGTDLKAYLEKRGSLSVSDAVPLIIQICFALIYAHEQGVVHRDIKPANILLTNPGERSTEGTVKVVDFGIAKILQADDDDTLQLTKTGEIFGSPPYMSPEQCKGGAIDIRSDIYSLGCVLYECLTGHPPFVGENAHATMMRRIENHAPTLKEGSLGGEFPALIEQVTAKMLERDPADRYQKLDPVVQDLMPLIMDPNADASGVLPAVTRNKKKILTIPKGPLLTFIAIALTFLATRAYDQWKTSKAQAVVVAALPSDGFPSSEIIKNTFGKKHRRFHFGLLPLGTIEHDNQEAPAVGDVDTLDLQPVYFKITDKSAASPLFFGHFVGDEFDGIAFIDNYFVDERSLVLLNKFTSLKRLKLENSKVKSLGFITDLNALKELSLTDLAIPTSDILKLPQLLQLNTLCFGPVPNEVAVLNKLKGSHELKVLTVRGGLTNADMHYFTQLPFVEELTIDKCPKLTEEGIKILAGMPSLKKLRLTDCPISDKVIPILRSFKGLTDLEMSTQHWSPDSMDELRRSKFHAHIVNSQTQNYQERGSLAKDAFNEAGELLDEPSLDKK